MIATTSIFIQSIGLVAMAVDLYASTLKSDKKMAYLNTVGSLLFALHYGLMGALAGAFSETLNATRTSISTWLKSRYLGLFFIIVYALLMFVQSETLLDTCPYLCGIIITVGLYYFDAVKLRLCYIVGYSLWLIYSIAVFSIGGIIVFSVTLITLSITVFRLHKDKTI